MRRALAERDTRETIKLIAISLLAMLLYLCLSFSSAYGYSISSLDRISINENDAINWESETWMSYRAVSSSITGTSTSTWNNYNWPSENMDDSHMNDGNSIVPSIPEPSIILLLGMGLGSFALYRKFRH